MNLQENIRRILREENTLPNLIRRRFSEEELDKLVSNVERTFETHRISQQHREDVIDAEIDDFIMNSVYYGEFEDFDDEIYQEIYNLYREPLVNYIKSKLDVNLQESIIKVLREVRVPRSERVELYKDENIIVVVPLTHRALQKYAHECQWCINDDLGEWEDYHKGRHVVIIQRNPKKPKIGITGNPTASEIFLLAKWDNNQSSFEDVCQMLDYEFRNDRTMSDYYVTISNDINNFATNIVYYSPETGIYDQEDNFLWNFNIEINDIPNVKPKVIEIMDDYLQENEEMSLQESIKKILREELDSDDIKSRQEEAAELIKRYGHYSSPDLRYITRPLYTYIEYENFGKLKELGVKYRFTPISEINLNGALSRFIKERGVFNGIGGNIIRLYNDEPVTKSDISRIKRKIQNIIDEFNTKLRTNYQIDGVVGEKSSDTLRNQLNQKLTGSEFNIEPTYNNIGIKISRGFEDEYLATIPMDEINKPQMLD